MAARPNALLRYIRSMAVAPAGNETSDAVLVNRFIADRDNRAFSDLVNRHGAMVLQVCRGILDDATDAEDALQATFLVLARKAHSLRSRQSLASWLRAIARRVSFKARALRARRFRLEMAARHRPIPRTDLIQELTCRELLEIVDEELERLPEKQRLAIVLCCLEGLSLEEAAARLGWKPGAVKGHLQRGRSRLHERLVHRGLTLSAALAAVEASRSPASAAVVARLAAATGRGATKWALGWPTSAPGISTGATILARAVLRAMAVTRLTLAAGFLLSMFLVAVGFAVHGKEQPPSTESLASDLARLPAATALVVDRRAEAADDDDVPIQVNGRVLDPAGKPFAGASLYVGYAISGGEVVERDGTPQAALPLRAKSGADGDFQFTFSRAELDGRMLDDSRPAVIAVADGYGPEWSQIAGPGQAEMLTLQLVEDKFPLNGRVLDAKGKPVAGAKIRVLNIDSDTQENTTRLLSRLNTTNDHRRRWRGAFPERPSDVATGADGRFTLTGLGRDRIAMLVHEPLSPHDSFYAIARPSNSAWNAQYHGATFDVLAPDTRLVRGVCRDRATGQPIAGVRMSVHVSHSGSFESSARLTDVNGRFELPLVRDILALAEARTCIVAEPDGEYFVASALVPRPAGSEPIAMDFDLVRGIPVAGKVQAPPGKKPPSVGRLDYYPLRPNIHAAKIQAVWPGTAASSGRIQPDGSYHLVVLPGPGAIAVAASPRRSFAAAVVDDEKLAGFFSRSTLQPDSQCPATIVGTIGGCFKTNWYNAVSLINPDENAQSLALDVELRTQAPLAGQLVDPDGQPLSGVRVVGLNPRGVSEVVEGSSFEISEMSPNEVREVVFLHREKKLGKLLSVNADDIGPLKVRLEPCGVITGRFVDRAGRPFPNSGVCWISFRPGRGTSEGWMVTTDQNGRFETALVPLVRYSFPGLSFPDLPTFLSEIVVQPGETKDLGNVYPHNNRPVPVK